MIKRRGFLLGLVAAPVGWRAVMLGAMHKGQGRRMFIGTTGDVSKGIYTAGWDGTTGTIGAVTLAAEVASPTFLALEHGHLYACSELDGQAAKATAYRGAGQGLERVNEQPTAGGGTTFISARGRGVFVANYGGGSVSSFHVQEDGGLSPVVSHFQYEGSGPVAGRQDRSHAHSALPSPDGRFLLVNDLGLDRIVVYRIDPKTAALTPNEPAFFTARVGAGPRHLAWEPHGRWVYSVNELDSTVDRLEWDAQRGVLTQREVVSTLGPEVAKGSAGAGEIQISRDGRFVYVGNRVVSDTIAVLSAERHTGVLTLEQVVSNGGRNTRFLTLDPTERWMVLCNQGSDEVVVMERDHQTGRLGAIRQRVPVDKPQCVVFA